MHTEFHREDSDGASRGYTGWLRTQRNRYFSVKLCVHSVELCVRLIACGAATHPGPRAWHYPVNSVRSAPPRVTRIPNDGGLIVSRGYHLGRRRLSPVRVRRARVLAAVRRGVRCGTGSTAGAGFPRPRDRHKAGPCRNDPWPQAGDPGELQRPLFASLRSDRADAGAALRESRRRGRHRPRLSVHPLAGAAARGRCRLHADGARTIHR